MGKNRRKRKKTKKTLTKSRKTTRKCRKGPRDFLSQKEAARRASLPGSASSASSL